MQKKKIFMKKKNPPPKESLTKIDRRQRMSKKEQQLDQVTTPTITGIVVAVAVGISTTPNLKQHHERNKNKSNIKVAETK